MKVLAAIVIALCAVSLTVAASTRASKSSSSSSSDEQNVDYDQRWQGQGQGQRQGYGQEQGQGNGQQRQNSWQQQQQQQRLNQQNTDDSQETDGTAWADVLPYRMKITQRLETSIPLGDQPKAKEKLMKFLEDKLNVCKTNANGKHQVDRHCIGRLTGQMMQLIAAFENGSRDMPGYEW